MQLYNVSHVIAYQNNYVRHYKKRPHQYELVKLIEEKNIHVFRVIAPSGPFYKGSGTVDATFNQIHVAVDDSQNEAIIRRNWDDKLITLPPAEIFPIKFMRT